MNIHEITADYESYRLNIYEITADYKRYRLNIYEITADNESCRLNIYEILADYESYRLNIYEITADNESCRLTFSVLSATHVTSIQCVLWVTYVAIPCAIGDLWSRSFISLNFAGLFSIEARISTHLLMMSHGENEAVNAATFNMFTGYFV